MEPEESLEFSDYDVLLRHSFLSSSTTRAEAWSFWMHLVSLEPLLGCDLDQQLMAVKLQPCMFVLYQDIPRCLVIALGYRGVCAFGWEKTERGIAGFLSTYPQE